MYIYIYSYRSIFPSKYHRLHETSNIKSWISCFTGSKLLLFSDLLTCNLPQNIAMNKETTTFAPSVQTCLFWPMAKGRLYFSTLYRDIMHGLWIRIIYIFGCF